MYRVGFWVDPENKLLTVVVATSTANAYLAAIALNKQSGTASYMQMMMAFDEGQYSCEKIRDIC